MSHEIIVDTKTKFQKQFVRIQSIDRSKRNEREPERKTERASVRKRGNKTTLNKNMIININ